MGRRLARGPAHILWCSTNYETGTTETVAPPSPALVGRSGHDICFILPSRAGMACRLLSASWPVAPI